MASGCLPVLVILQHGEQQLIERLTNPVTYEMARLYGMSHALAERTDYIQRFATRLA